MSINPVLDDYSEYYTRPLPPCPPPTPVFPSTSPRRHPRPNSDELPPPYSEVIGQPYLFSSAPNPFRDEMFGSPTRTVPAMRVVKAPKIMETSSTSTKPVKRCKSENTLKRVGEFARRTFSRKEKPFETLPTLSSSWTTFSSSSSSPSTNSSSPLTGSSSSASDSPPTYWESHQCIGNISPSEYSELPSYEEATAFFHAYHHISTAQNAPLPPYQ